MEPSGDASRCQEIHHLGPCPRQARYELANFARGENDHAQRVTPAVEGFAFPPRDIRRCCKFWCNGRHVPSIATGA